MKRWWAATEGIRFIAVCVIAMAVLTAWAATTVPLR